MLIMVFLYKKLFYTYQRIRFYQVDWDSALRNDDGIVNSLGLYDLDRKIRLVGVEYKNLITQWQDVIAKESFGVHIF